MIYREPIEGVAHVEWDNCDEGWWLCRGCDTQFRVNDEDVYEWFQYCPFCGQQITAINKGE